MCRSWLNVFFLPRVRICFYFHTLGYENIEKKKIIQYLKKLFHTHTYIHTYIYTHMYTHIHTYKYAHYIFLWESRNTPLAWRQLLAALRKNRISLDGILETIFLPRVAEAKYSSPSCSCHPDPYVGQGTPSWESQGGCLKTAKTFTMELSLTCSILPNSAFSEFVKDAVSALNKT